MTLPSMVREMLSDLTQSQLAEKTGVDQATISKIKNDRINVRHEKGEKIRRFYIEWQALKGTKGE